MSPSLVRGLRSVGKDEPWADSLAHNVDNSAPYGRSSEAHYPAARSGGPDTERESTLIARRNFKSVVNVD